MISILLPTTGRTQMALQTLGSILGTKGKPGMEFIVAIDNDLATKEAVEDFFNEWGVTNFHIDYSEDYRGCSKAWQDAYEHSKGDLIVFCADDLIFHDGWLEAAMKKMKELPKGGGLVGFNDTQLNGEGLATHYMLSRWFIENCMGGHIAWECYRHSFNDLEVNERAKRAGRFIFAPDAVVEHKHWTFGTRPKDDTDVRFLEEHGASQASYHEREAAGFPD